MAVMAHRTTSSLTVTSLFQRKDNAATSAAAGVAAVHAPPPTCNQLDAELRMRYIKTSRKLYKVLGATPLIADSAVAAAAALSPYSGPGSAGGFLTPVLPTFSLGPSKTATGETHRASRRLSAPPPPPPTPMTTNMAHAVAVGDWVNTLSSTSRTSARDGRVSSPVSLTHIARDRSGSFTPSAASDEEESSSIYTASQPFLLHERQRQRAATASDDGATADVPSLPPPVRKRKASLHISLSSAVALSPFPSPKEDAPFTGYARQPVIKLPQARISSSVPSPAMRNVATSSRIQLDRAPTPVSPEYPPSQFSSLDPDRYFSNETPSDTNPTITTNEEPPMSSAHSRAPNQGEQRDGTKVFEEDLVSLCESCVSCGSLEKSLYHESRDTDAEEQRQLTEKEAELRRRKRQMEKLMRHLGECVPSELVFRSPQPRANSDKARSHGPRGQPGSVSMSVVDVSTTTDTDAHLPPSLPIPPRPGTAPSTSPSLAPLSTPSSPTQDRQDSNQENSNSSIMNATASVRITRRVSIVSTTGSSSRRAPIVGGSNSSPSPPPHVDNAQAQQNPSVAPSSTDLPPAEKRYRRGKSLKKSGGGLRRRMTDDGQGYYDYYHSAADAETLVENEWTPEAYQSIAQKLRELR